MSEWETFCDISYYDLWRVRRKTERGFNDGYHLQHGEEAKALVDLLNRLERERDEARAIAYDLATIASHCLGWHDHETGDAAERIASVLRRWKDAK